MSELHRPQRAIAAGCSCLLIFLLLSMLGLILLAAGIHLLRSTVPRAFAALYLVPPWAFLVLCAAGLGKLPLSPRRFAFALGLASLLAKGAVALLVQTPPESDFYLLYYAARELARGNNILNETQYFQFWAYQSGFVAWMAFFIRVFHAGLPFFLVENVAASSATTVLIYVLCKRVATHRSAAVAALVYLCYPASFFLIPVLTNQFLSELCLAGALCLYLDPRQRAWGRLLAAGVLLAVGNIFRPMSMVVVLAVVGAAVLGLLGGRGLRESALPCLLLCAGYFAVTQGASLWVRLSGLNANGLTNQLPLWKLLLGLNQATSGRYSGADAALVFQSPHPAAAAEALLRERLAAYDLPGLLRLFWAKISLMWGSFEDSSWALTGQALDALGARALDGPVLYWADMWRRFGAGFYTAALALAGAGGWRLRGGFDRRWVLLLAAGLYFTAHLLIEIQVRYRAALLLFLLPLAASGMDLIAEKTRRRSAPQYAGRIAARFRLPFIGRTR